MEHYQIDALAAITVVSRSLGIATPCCCFGGCKGFATGSTLGTFGVAALIGALLEPSDAMAVASCSLGTATPCGCFAGGGEGFVTTGLTLGTFGTATISGALPGPSDETTVVSRSLGAATPRDCFGNERMDDVVWALLGSVCCTARSAERKVGCQTDAGAFCCCAFGAAALGGSLGSGGCTTAEAGAAARGLGLAGAFGPTYLL